MATTTGTVVFYDIFAESMGDGTIDLDTNTFQIRLFTSSYTPNVATDVTDTALANEVANGNGYTTGGQALGSVTWTQSGGVATFDFANPVWTASGGSIVARYYVIHDETAATNNLVCYGLLDNTPADVTTTDTNTLTVNVNASGLFTSTLTDA